MPTTSRLTQSLPVARPAAPGVTVEPGSKMPTVSVCLPTRNRAQQLRHALGSVLAQTYRDFEICVSDNASSDETAEVVASFADRRIRYHRNVRDIGGYRNHIVALGLARGRYCAVIHDDTSWSPTFLGRLLKPLLDDPSLDLAFCDHWVTDGIGEVQTALTDRVSRFHGRASLTPGRHQPFTTIALRRRSVLLTAAVVRREILATADLFDSRSGFVLDFYLLARVAQAGGAAFYVPDRLASYAVHDGSTSGTHQAEIWRHMAWACADLYRRSATRDERRALQLTWGEVIAHEAITLCRTLSWRELRLVADQMGEVPKHARFQVGLATLVMAGSIGIGRALRRFSG